MSLIPIISSKKWNNRYSMSFNGVNEGINIDAVRTALATTTVGTWAHWYRPTVLSNQNSISFGDTDANSFILINPFTDGLVYCTCLNAGTVQWQVKTTNVALSVATWVHIGLVQDGVSPVIYINGVAVALTWTVTTDKTVWFNNISGLDNGRIGCRNANSAGNTNFVGGYIDEVPFFNINFSEAKMSELYNGGKPKNVLKHSASSSLVSYFRNGDGDSFDGTNWTLFDKKGTNSGTSFMMEENDRSIIIP